jgi:hypothetical protein
MGMQIAAPRRHVVLKIADPVDDRHGFRRAASIEQAAFHHN